MRSNKKYNIGKCILSAILPWAYLLVCFGFKYKLILFFPALLLLSFLYIAPFFTQAAQAKNEDIKSIKPFIISDALFALLPSLLSCTLTSVVLDVFFEGFDLVWFFSPILMAVFVFLTLYFWLKYYVNNKVLKKIKKPER